MTMLAAGIIYGLFFLALVAVAVVDLRTMEIPDKIHVLIAFLAVVKLVLYPSLAPQMLVGAVAVSVPMLVITLLTGGFGGGDIKLMAAAGLLLGVKSIVVSFVFAVVLMGSFGMILVLRKMLFKRDYKSKVPFGPALSAGCVVGTFFGEYIANWYLNLILL